MPQDADAFITIARVQKVQGRVGEVFCELHTDFPERFEQRTRLYAWYPAKDTRRELQLEDYWPHKGGMVLKFADVDSIEDAELLLGGEIQIPLHERTELEEGAYYISDLLGCRVSDQGRELGAVADVNFGTGTAPLLIVTGDGREYMIPFVESFVVKLDVPAKRIEMKLPEGMLELDAPLKPAKKVPAEGKQ
ncbi:MAG: ribosome maturation factor RimM [Acidobacteriota bacterium]|nr:ribosome maturation factor RimM [Acidobacteriota bacterium]